MFHPLKNILGTPKLVIKVHALAYFIIKWTKIELIRELGDTYMEVVNVNTCCCLVEGLC